MKGRILVLGGGTNGLCAATRLARGGCRVTLLEARPVLGGLAAGEEFAPGFRHAGILHDAAHLPRELAGKLNLAGYGLERTTDDAPLLALDPASKDGPSLALYRDTARTRAEIERHSPSDASAYVDWRTQVERLSEFARRVLAEQPPEIDPRSGGAFLELAQTAVALRRLGEADMLELMRVAPMAVADWMKDSFASPRLQAALAAPALSGTWLGPWSAGSAALLLLHHATRGHAVRGGAAAVATALEAAAQAAGVDLRTKADVQELVVEGGRVRGARLAGGEVIEADGVLSTLEPKRTLMGLVPRTELPPEYEEVLARWRTRGTTAKVHLGLDGEVPWPEDARRDGAVPAGFTTGAHLDELERAFDAVKYGELSERPVLDVRVIPQADERKRVLSVLVHYAPFDLRGGWDDSARDTLEGRVLSLLEDHLPGLGKRVKAAETLTPVDLEQRFGMTGGHVHHGEHALDQLLFLRPTLDSARYRTPIQGLFLGGRGSHPGGTVPAAPGALASQALLDG